MSREAIRGNCRDTVAVLSELMEGALSAAAAGEARAHLHDCPRCRELLDSVRALPGAVRALSDELPAPGLEQRIVERLGLGSRR